MRPRRFFGATAVVAAVAETFETVFVVESCSWVSVLATGAVGAGVVGVTLRGAGRGIEGSGVPRVAMDRMSIEDWVGSGGGVTGRWDRLGVEDKVEFWVSEHKSMLSMDREPAPGAVLERGTLGAIGVRACVAAE